MESRASFAAAREVLQHGLSTQAFPAAVIEVGNATRPLWREPFGTLTFEPGARATQLDTVFDLASLTKVIATAPLLMRAIEHGTVSLDDPVSRHVDIWRGNDRADVTIRDLLSHSSGLPAYLPLYRDHHGRSAFEAAICATPLEYPPRSASIYSDLGFMLLGFLIERGAGLDAGFRTLLAQMGSSQDIQFTPPDAWKWRTAPTEFDPWRDALLVGEVHDENAAALGGVAGHAGLFGTAAAVGDYARHLLQVLDGRAGAFRRATVEQFIARRTGIPGSSRALGWDTMLPTSSCGTRISTRGFGHTGFTGTSLWIDPDRRVYVTLLTNRVHPSRQNGIISLIRPAVHDAVFEALDSGL